MVDGLYDSGELTIKRNNKEFLNTTQADYTFENSVSVLAGISRKPFRSTLNAQAQQKLQSDYNQERKASYQQDPDERNRYLLLDRYDATKYRR